jgi:hypothetical protein
MGEPQLPGVQHVTGSFRFPAVDGIAEKTVPQMSEVHPDLMGATRVESALHNRRSRTVGIEFAEHPPVRSGMAAPALGQHRHFLPVNRMPSQRLPHHPLPGTERTQRQRDVNFQNVPS